MHCNISQTGLNLIVDHIGISLQKDTDTSAAVDVRNHTSICFHFLKSSDIQIFTDNCNFCYQSIFYSHGLVLCPWLCHKCVHISRIAVQCLIRNCCYIFLERLVLCHKICLRVHFYDRSCLVIFYNCHNKTFCRNSSGFLLSLCLTVLSQVFDSCIHITIGLAQSLLAVHHACACHFSQFFYHACCDCHDLFPPIMISPFFRVGFRFEIRHKIRDVIFTLLQPRLPLLPLPHNMSLLLHPDLPQLQHLPS